MLVTITTEDGNLHNVEVDGDSTAISAFKQVAEAHTGVPASEQQFWHSGNIVADNGTIKSAGIKENDLVLLRRVAAQQENMPAAVPAAANAIIGNILSNPQLLARFPPHVQTALQQRDPATVQGLLNALQHLQGQQGMGMAVEDEFDPEAQARIAERIRQENISTNMEAALEHSPEVFGEIVMLYVHLEVIFCEYKLLLCYFKFIDNNLYRETDTPQVNSVPLKAFVDSGAQSCVMSLACAERCNIAHLIDRRFHGVVHGVGTQKFIGRVHSVRVKVGEEHVPMAVTVIEQLGIDFLFGLDMLRRCKCSIDLEHNCLRFGSLENTSLQFLPEHEVPNRMPHTPAPGADGLGLGPNPSAAAGAAAAARAAESALSPVASGVPSVAARASAAAASHLPSPQPQGRAEQSGNGSGVEAKIEQLMGLGFPRHECVAALESCNGDVSQAAALLFDS